MELPFELNKKHKNITKNSWKRRGLNMCNFEKIYERYILSGKCEICEKTFKTSLDRRLQFSSENIICNSCFYTKEFIHRDDIPFGLHKYHKIMTKYRWKKQGLICNDNEFEAIYEKYITSRKCDICNKTFKNTRDRQMEHNHANGEFRNIVCNKCNCLKSDKKIPSNNTSGYTGISKCTNKECKVGFNWHFRVNINGKRRTIKTSTDLDFLIKYADKWKLENNYNT